MKFLSLEFELPLMAFLFILLLCSVYFFKKKISLIENKPYEIILLASLFSSAFDTIIHIIGACNEMEVLNSKYYKFIDFSNKIVATMFVLIFSCLLLYTLVISYQKIRNKFKKCLFRLGLCNILFFIITLFLHIEIIEIVNVKNTIGTMMTFTYLVIAVLLGATVFFTLINFKKDKRYYAIFMILLMLIILYCCSLIFKGLIIYDLIMALLCYIMYFTIENPDTKMIEQLNENRMLIEKANEDKSNFLFRMSQEVKQPIDDIIRANNIIKETENLELIENGTKYIEYNAKHLKSIVNNILGVTSLDSYNIKTTSHTYDVNNFFNSIITKYSSQVNKNVEFRFNISKGLPKTLYGDAVKLKQVISTIIENAIEHTKSGYIHLNVDELIKNDICRLIISIEDSGSGMSIDKVNELLSLDQELTSEDKKTLEQVILNLNIATKIVKVLGGNILIKSEENKGSEFIIAIEQKIKKEKVTDEKLEQYTEVASKNKRVLLVDNSKEFIEQITKELKKYNVDIVTTMYGADCVEKIKSKQKYDLIILDDDMQPDTGLATLQELQKISKFKIPVIVTLEKNKEQIKEHYIEEGFKDYLLKYELETETKRIAEKYL